jgi:VanZ family protein
MPRALRFAVYRLPALLYMALIFRVNSGPITNPALQSVPDYLLHALGYAALYVLIHWAVHEGLAPRPGRGGYLLPLLVTVLYGASDEYHQAFVEGRDSSIYDWFADAAGAIAAAGALAAWSAMHSRRHNRATASDH